MTKLIVRCVGFAWTGFAAVVISVAVVITLIRLALPQIDHQRAAIADWLSTVTGRPVEIGRVSASWHGWAPRIDLENLAILAPDSKESLIEFAHGAIDIAPLASVRQRALVPQKLSVSGMRIALSRDADGAISIAGMPPRRWPVAQWLLQQKNFVLQDAAITFIDHGRAPIHYDDVTISIGGDNLQRKIAARLRPQGSSDARLAIALLVSGDILGSDWSGKATLAIRDVDSARSIGLFRELDRYVADGRINAIVDTHWDHAKLQSVTIDLDHAAIRWRESPVEHYLNMRGRGVANRTANGWSMRIDPIEIEDKTLDSQIETAMAIRWRQGHKGSPLLVGRSEDINLSLLALYLRLAANKHLPDEFSDLDLAALRGSASGLLAVNGAGNTTAENIFVRARVENFVLPESKHWPGVAALDFAIIANPSAGLLHSEQSDTLRLRKNAWFVEPIDIDRFAGTIRWARGADGLLLNSDLFEVHAESIQLATRGSLRWQANRSDPHLQLLAKIHSGDVARFGALVPRGVLPTRGDKWLRTAFTSGHFAPSTILIHGWARDIPYDLNNGTLQTNVALQDVDLRYSAKWPIARAVDASVRLNGRRLQVAVDDGSMYSAALDGTVIELPDLFSHKRVLHLRGTSRIVPAQLSKFIVDSPLQKTKASRYAEVRIEEPFSLSVDLELGLYPGGQRDVLGLVHFDNNTLHATQFQLSLENLSGDVSFTRQDWYGEDLVATIFGDRVGILVNGGVEDPNYDTEFRITGTSTADMLLKHVARFAPQAHTLLETSGANTLLGGKTTWKALVSLPESPQGTKNPSRRISLQSSLEGLNIALPAPLGKPAPQKLPLAIRIDVDNAGNRDVRVTYDTRVRAAFSQQKQADGNLTTVHRTVHFGDSAPPEGGNTALTVSGKINHLVVDEWALLTRKFFPERLAAPTATPAQVALEVAQLDVLGRRLQGATISGGNEGANWQLSLSSAQAQGELSWDAQKTGGVLSLDFDHLNLEAPPEKNAHRNIDPRSLPRIDFTCDALRFADIDLGAAVLHAQPIVTGLALEKLSFSQAGFALSGAGEWTLDAGVHQSQISMRVEDDTLGGLLERFGFGAANIDGGRTNIRIAAVWGGMPSEFALEKLQGSFGLDVKEGRFLDIEPGGGRLFGLLSLQTLPRRLSFDFNDLFRKGFTFDNITGTFELDRGNAYTNGLLMHGPSARIDISGRTGLAEKDYDQRVVVTPALSDTFPVASALFGPAGIGVGAVIYLGQKMFKSIPEQVDKLLSREYSITGSWDKPVIDRI